MWGKEANQQKQGGNGQALARRGQQPELRIAYGRTGGRGVWMALAVLLLTSAWLWRAPQRAHAAAFADLPTGFVLETVVSGGGLFLPTAIAFGPDNTIYLAQKNGVVRVAQNGVVLPTPFIDISDEVNDILDRGLLGLALHPNFPATPYVYLLYVYDPPGVTKDALGARVSRLLRVTANASNPRVASTATDARVVLLGTNSTLANSGNVSNEDDDENPACGKAPNYVRDCVPADYNTHTVGTVMFGADGKLYVSNGDGARFTYPDPRALRSLDLDSLAGKVLRLDPLTGQGLPDNPFFNNDVNANRSKVLNLGFRNPFRFTLHPTTDEPYIGDVGLATWEELNVGRGKNFGWPCYEGGSGISLQLNDYANNANTRTRCQQLYQQGLAAVQAPAYAYQHTLDGASIQAGAFYTGTSYPAEYRGALFIGDYSLDTLSYVKFNAQGAATVTPFARHVADQGTGGSGFVQIVRGPDTNLYVVVLGAQNEIRRLRYVGANQPPVAAFVPSMTSGPLPLAVNFTNNSFDADAQALTFLWEFGDGTTSNLRTPSHTFTTAGVYNVRLTVTDPAGATNTAQATIRAGNLRPTVTINAPTSTTRYNVGSTINYGGTATDAEDGDISARIEWTAILHHNEHTHFDAFRATGASGSFVVPDHGDDTYYELCAKVTDSGGGVSETKCVELRPNLVRYTFVSVPTKRQLNYDGITRTTPFTVLTIPGSRRNISAARAQNGDLFSSWSIGGQRAQIITIGTTDQTITAFYRTSASFLSDLEPTFIQNGLGPYERDKSNGGAAAGDGRTITLQGVTYAKGLGVAARSELHYNLNGLFQRFLADIGLDDEVGYSGNVVFKVFVDGVLQYDSGLMRGFDATKQIEINVAGKQELRLVVEPSGLSASSFDRADWANARVVK